MAVSFGIGVCADTVSDEHWIDGPDHASDREQSLNIVVFEEVFPRKKQNLYAVGAVIGWIICCAQINVIESRDVTSVLVGLKVCHCLCLLSLSENTVNVFQIMTDWQQNPSGTL